MAEQWDAFTGLIPPAERGNLVQAYYDRLTKRPVRGVQAGQHELHATGSHRRSARRG